MPKSAFLTARLSADPEARAKISYATYPQGYRLHYHSFFEFSFAVDGEALHLVNGEPLHFSAGDICLLTPAVLHQFIPIKGAKPLTMYNLSFSPEPIRPEFWSHVPAHALPITSHIEGNTFTSVCHAFESMKARASKEKLPFDIVTQTAIEWTILNIMETTPHPLSEEYMKIRPALIYIQNNFTAPLTLAEVADAAHFSREYFSALFHQGMGVSFQDYLLDLRLNFAADLLVLTDFSVSDICYMSGFRTLSYFIRTFAKQFGATPGQFRMEKQTGVRE